MLSDALYCIIAYTYRLCANKYKLASCCTRLAERESFRSQQVHVMTLITGIFRYSQLTDIKAAAAAVCTLPVEERRVPGTRMREVVRLTPVTHYTFQL